MEWCAIYDTTKGAPSDPNAVALVLVNLPAWR
jgi:hypothetical protein